MYLFVRAKSPAQILITDIEDRPWLRISSNWEIYELGS